MRLAVILASIVFWTALFKFVLSLFSGEGEAGYASWATISYFWLRFETLYATRGCQNQQSGASQ